TARDPRGRPTVLDLVRHPSRVVPVGRLDADTTGALLLTNDGELAHRLAHPRYRVDKVYEVEVEGEPSDAALRRLRRGVELEDGRTAPARVRRLGPSRLEITIHEGRKHQVKRMCAAIGHPVVHLHRARYAGLSLEGLAPGEWRALRPPEVPAWSVYRGDRLWGLASAGRYSNHTIVARIRYRATSAHPSKAGALPSPVICHRAMAITARAPMERGLTTKVSRSAKRRERRTSVAELDPAVERLESDRSH
ncbi:MAG: hypothetical protein C4305_07685, partial [Thermoleophilia bacterium]